MPLSTHEQDALQTQAKTALSQQRERRLVRAAVAGDHDTAVRCNRERRAPPVGGDPAGPFDDRQHRTEIVGLQARFNNEVDEPVRQQAVGIAVGAEPHELDGGGDPGEARPCRCR